MPTKILTCKCKSEYQDKRYGKNRRVHNQGGTIQTPTWKCTVCSDKKR